MASINASARDNAVSSTLQAPPGTADVCVNDNDHGGQACCPFGSQGFCNGECCSGECQYDYGSGKTFCCTLPTPLLDTARLTLRLISLFQCTFINAKHRTCFRIPAQTVSVAWWLWMLPDELVYHACDLVPDACTPSRG